MTLADRKQRRAWLRASKLPTLTEEIARIDAACERRKAEIDGMERRAQEAGACCAQCLFGAKFVDACNAQERRVAWLCNLLDRRGTQGDCDRAAWMRSIHEWCAKLNPRHVQRKPIDAEGRLRALLRPALAAARAAHPASYADVPPDVAETYPADGLANLCRMHGVSAADIFDAQHGTWATHDEAPVETLRRWRREHLEHDECPACDPTDGDTMDVVALERWFRAHGVDAAELARRWKARGT